MDTQVISTLPAIGAPVKTSDRTALFQLFRDFAIQQGYNPDRYPINKGALHHFCASIGIGKKSRKARKWRRHIKDIISRPARLNAGVPPKAGPPQGPPDRFGVRPYHTLEQSRRAGVKSGAVRRFNVRQRDARIRKLAFKRGLTKNAIATIMGVSVRTVYYALKRRPFTKIPKPKKDCNPGTATNNQRQTRAGQQSGPVLPQPPSYAMRPRHARPFVAHKLHWLPLLAQHVAASPDPRLHARRSDILAQEERSLARYAAAVCQREGPDHWDLILESSHRWLNDIHAHCPDPTRFLAQCLRDAAYRKRHAPSTPSSKSTRRRRDKSCSNPPKDTAKIAIASATSMSAVAGATPSPATNQIPASRPGSDEPPTSPSIYSPPTTSSNASDANVTTAEAPMTPSHRPARYCTDCHRVGTQEICKCGGKTRLGKQPRASTVARDQAQLLLRNPSIPAPAGPPDSLQTAGDPP